MAFSTQPLNFVGYELCFTFLVMPDQQLDIAFDGKLTLELAPLFCTGR
jgi:hypothetical protein